MTDQTTGGKQHPHAHSREQAFCDGFAAGSRWAEYAGEGEVRRLRMFRRSMGNAWPAAFDSDGGGGDNSGNGPIRTPGEQLYSVLSPADGWQPQQGRAFWQSVAWRIGSEQSASPLWVLGFAEGVLSGVAGSETTTGAGETAETAEETPARNGGSTPVLDRATAEQLRRICLLIESTAWHPVWQRQWLRKCGVESLEDLDYDKATELQKHLMDVELGNADH